MKKCPQCEFIYEDDQSLCDMDGVLLVFDSRTLPNLHALATVEGPLPGKVQRRYRMAPAFATILLALGLGSAYFVTTQRTAAPALDSPASVTAEAPAAVPAASVEAPVPAPSPEVNEAQPPTSEPATKSERKPAAAPPAKKAAAQPAAVKPAENKKEDSKVGSILKKTGKILKKPFKF